MASKSKKIKLEVLPEAENRTFLDLNDDCLLIILEKLSPNDLCSISFTCKHMQTLAFAQFQREFPNECIKIKTNSSTRNQRSSVEFVATKSSYLKYFSKCIRNVELNGGNFEVERLFNFIKSKCCDNLKKLQMHLGGQIKTNHGEIIKDQLKNLESLSISGIHETSDVRNGLLKYCENLKHFEIETERWCWNTKWMQHEYPSLKSMKISLSDAECFGKIFDDHAGVFFRINPQLKDISCTGIKTTGYILRNCQNIKRLSVIFEANDRFEDIYDELITYCKQSPIESLELDFSKNDKLKTLTLITGLDSINPIRGLGLKMQNKSDAPIIIMNFKQLRKLKLVCEPWVQIPDEVLENISKKLPLLEEFQIFALWRPVFMLKKLLMLFVINSLSLNMLMFSFASREIDFTPNDLIELNRTRRTSAKACNMTINLQAAKRFFPDSVPKMHDEPVLKKPSNSMLRINFKTVKTNGKLVEYVD